MGKNDLYYIFILFLFLSISIDGKCDDNKSQETLFYYSFQEKIEIEEIPGKLIVKKNGLESKVLESIVVSTIGNAVIEWFSPDICLITTDNSHVEKLRIRLLEENAILSVRNVYVISNDAVFSNNKNELVPFNIGFVDHVDFKFYDHVEKTVQDSVLQTLGLKAEYKSDIFYSAPVSKHQNVIEIANNMYNTGYFRFASPEIICKTTKCDDIANYPNDPYFTYQVTLHNTGQYFNGHTGTNDADIDAPQAWAYTMGSEDIIIAVIDDGLTANHPDLPNSRQVRLQGSNFGLGDPDDPSPSWNHNHGNACSGVIAATMNNNEGIAGVAPLCKIMPIRTDSTTTPNMMATAIEFAALNSANIISCSWGYNTNSSIIPTIIAAIEYAVYHNTVVLFSAGNTASHITGSDGYVLFPANQDINGMLTIGASDRNDEQADYSPSSALIDIVAPSHKAYPFNPNYNNGIVGENLDMWTIDIPGDAGYNPWHSTLGSYYQNGETCPNFGTNYLSYTGFFGGTSHSCPVVAGVAALVLSMNPNLSPQMVCDVLKRSADKIGNYSYDINGRCDETGYGRVNAFNAVSMLCDTTYLINENIYQNVRTVAGCNVSIESVNVVGESLLRVKYKNRVEINNNFHVWPGSILEIKHY
jgi:subtilisin family serine protease